MVKRNVTAADRWDEFTPNQRVYDSFSNQWDLCTALAPTEDAEPDNQYDDYYDDDDDFRYHEPASPADLIPSIPDVPGHQTMEEETGERAAQVLERAYDLDREHVDEDADHLAGWRKQEVKSTLTLRFGFNEPAAAPIFSPQQMESKQWVDCRAGVIVSRISRNLVELGAEFYPSWQRPVHRRRPPGYKPTHIDHGVYVQQRDAFLRSPRGRAALFYGGVVGRLARLAIQDFEDVACLDPSEDILEAGAHVSSANGEEGGGMKPLQTKRSTLSVAYTWLKRARQKSSKEEEGEQLKYISWWPTPPAFFSSGLNTDAVQMQFDSPSEIV
ncbi:hypothetical protein C8R47DRAFT_1085249 [Mycena vitilis]|nr:hypothetical protein C8R47DRAFT_1085249 [Mycena vitilis]